MISVPLQFDIFVEFAALLTALLITGFTLYAYHRTHELRHLAFAAAFGFISVGSLASLIFHWLVQLEVMLIPVRGYLAIPSAYDYFRFFSQLFFMVGYLGLFLVGERVTCKRTSFLLMLVAPLTALVAHEVFSVYHAIAVVVLSFVCYQFYRAFLQTGATNARNIATAFGILLLSELSFIFTVFNVGFYHAGEVLRLGAFLLILFTLGRIYLLAQGSSRVAVFAHTARKRGRK
jgi:hypothetical protein